MKPLKGKVEFETADTIFELGEHRPVIVSVGERVLVFRLKGLQRTYDLPAGHCYHAAVKATVASAVKAKVKRRGKK